MNQSERNVSMKPTGLWVSVEGEDGWKEWCEETEFRLSHLNVAYKVELKAHANVLHLRSPASLIEFTKKYPCTDPRYAQYEALSSLYLDWFKVKQHYQGVIISPYQWSCRFDLMWYYGWDCASGCIWDLSCVEGFELVNKQSVEPV